MKKILFASFPVGIVNTLSWFGIFTFVNTYVIQGMHYTNKDWTALTLWFIGGNIFWQFACTEISSRVSRRTTVFLSMLIASAVFAALGYFKSLHMLGLLLFLIAFMPAVLTGVWLPLVAETGKDFPGRAMGLSQLVGNFITMITLFLGGYLLNVANFTETFLYFSIICLLCGIVFYGLTSSFSNNQPENFKSILKISKSDVATLLKSPFAWILFAGVCMEPFNFHTANQLFPNLARDVHGFSEQSISTTVAFGRMPALISLLFMARFIDCLIPSRYYSIGIFLAGAGIVFLGFAGNSLFLILAYIFFYLGHGMVWGTNSASVNWCVEPKLRDSAFAIMSIFMTFSIFLVGTIHYLFLQNGVTLRQIFIFCGIIACTGALILFFRSLKLSKINTN